MVNFIPNYAVAILPK